VNYIAGFEELWEAFKSRKKTKKWFLPSSLQKEHSPAGTLI
jgi:hypothetical protein